MLKYIHLAENNIGDHGCSDLIEADWPLLEQIYLCNSTVLPREK